MPDDQPQWTPVGQPCDADLSDTDLYCLRMAQSHWLRGRAEDEVTFELFVRSLPKNRGYLVVAGLADALSFLERFHLADEEQAYLAHLGFRSDFLAYLSALRFTGTVRAIPEGTLIGAQYPILSVTAPRIQAEIVESVLLSIINHQTMVASKAARIVHAAQGRPVYDFSLRRRHHTIAIARAAYLGGCAGTSHVKAAMRLGIPCVGTMAHHYVMAQGRDREQTAFTEFLEDWPDHGILLPDTYSTPEGVDHAIAASRQTGIPMQGVRLDSGDLAELSKLTRRKLNRAGMTDANVTASNDLDEWKITALLAAGAPIDAFGVGTMLGAVADHPYLGGVYKISEQHAEELRIYIMKLAPGKSTDPGRHQVWRLPDGSDVLTLAAEPAPVHGAHPLLIDAMVDGAVVWEERLEQIRDNALLEVSALPAETLALDEPVSMKLRRSQALWQLRASLDDPDAAEYLEQQRAHDFT